MIIDTLDNVNRIHDPYQLVHYGTVLNLYKFPGPVYLEKNIFQDNHVMYDNCEMMHETKTTVEVTDGSFVQEL